MTPTLDPRRTPPEIDAAALSALRDGRPADVSGLVRRNLATYASVLEEAEVTRLCRRVRPIAVPSVDAFGVPPEMLRSPDLVG